MYSPRLLFITLYAASGAAGLVYEVAWTRLLTLALGHTVAAASTVLAAFMGGLALGAWLAGRAERRRGADAIATRSRLRMYAALELIVALSAVVLPAVLSASTPLLAWAYHDGLAPARFGLTRVLVCAALVGVPATAMGATFPVAVGWYARGAADAGVLYAVNTAGAAAGAIATGFFLLPWLGLRATTWIGVALNVFAACGALAIASRPPAAASDASETSAMRRKKRAGSDTADTIAAQPALAITAAAICGFLGLSFEVIWTRLLTLVVGPTTYAFTTVLVSFIVGITIGSAAGARLARRTVRPVAWLGAVLVVGALSASIAAWFTASRLPLIVAAQVADPSASFGGVVWRQALSIVVMLLPMTAAFGAAFPLALALASGTHQSVAGAAARVYTANTVGAIAGALVAGFGMVPGLGLEISVRVIVVTAIAVGGAYLAAARDRRSALMRAAVPVAAAIVSIVVLPRWDRALLASGAYKYAAYIDPVDLEVELRAWQIPYHKDGAVATVSVRELAGTRSLVIDGKVDASNAGDMLTQRLLGLLPVLMHRDPQEICVIGLGSGVTVASAVGSGRVRHADVVEISPEVVEASAFFDRENQRVLQSPAVRLIVGDGRSHLALTPQRYDVIVSEPSNPWMAGIAPLFTREFFEAARARLKPDGIVCQWAHAYDISDGDLRSIVGTFNSVFPAATMWLIGESDVLLIGMKDGDVDDVYAALARVEATSKESKPRALLNDVGIAPRGLPFALFTTLAGGPDDVLEYGHGASIQTDDRMVLEYSAPRAIYGRPSTETAAGIRRFVAHRIPQGHDAELTNADAWTVAGTMELKADAYAIAYERFELAVRMDTRNTEALSGLTTAAAGARRQDEARTFLRAIASAEPENAVVRLELSRLLAAEGDREGAVAAGAEALRIAPADPVAAEQLASIFADAGDAQRLRRVVEPLAARFPARDRTMYFQGHLAMLEARPADAVEAARRVVAANPRDVRAQNLLGIACATQGLDDCAQQAFAAAREANPKDATTYVNLGVYHLQSRNAAAAVENFSVALTLDRSSAAARQGLAEARAAIGDTR